MCNILYFLLESVDVHFTGNRFLELRIFTLVKFFYFFITIFYIYLSVNFNRSHIHALSSLEL